MDARGKFGEHEKCVRVARGAAESNSSCLSQGRCKEGNRVVQSITSTLSTNDANRILEQIETNTQQVFNTTKDRHKQKFEKLIREKQAAVSLVDTPYVDKTK